MFSAEKRSRQFCHGRFYFLHSHFWLNSKSEKTKSLQMVSNFLEKIAALHKSMEQGLRKKIGRKSPILVWHQIAKTVQDWWKRFFRVFSFNNSPIQLRIENVLLVAGGLRNFRESALHLLSTFQKITLQINFFSFSRDECNGVHQIDQKSILWNIPQFLTDGERSTTIGKHRLGLYYVKIYIFWATTRLCNTNLHCSEAVRGFLIFFPKKMRYKYLFYGYFTLHLLSSKFLKFQNMKYRNCSPLQLDFLGGSLIFGSTLVINCGDYYHWLYTTAIFWNKQLLFSFTIIREWSWELNTMFLR